MTPRRLTRLLLACFLLALVASGCGEKGEDIDPVREGIAAPVGGIDYNVFITRQLNPRDVFDEALYNGPEDAEECRDRSPEAELTPEERPQRCPTNLFGVFIQVCNETTDGTPTPAREPTDVEGREFAGDFEIEDSQGNKFEPIPLPRTNHFAYRARPLEKGDCIPAVGSAADTSPPGAAMLLFRLPVAATENRPLELSVSDGGETRHFELDI